MIVSETPRPPEYDAELEIAGETWLLTRSLGLVRRIEQRFGALPTLMRNLEAANVTQAQIAMLTAEILRGSEGAPDRVALERWVYEEGTFKLCGPLAKLVGELCIGNRHLRELEDRRRVAAEDGRQNPTRPAPAPATTG